MIAPTSLLAPTCSDKAQVFFGTYTSNTSRGIYSARVDLRTGHISGVQLAAETPNPSFIVVHPNGKSLYAVNETLGGAACAFLITDDGRLKPLNRESTRGDAPCHICIDKKGRNVLVANYCSGTVAVLPIAGDGRLRPVTSSVQHTGSSMHALRQEAPHAHGVYTDQTDRFVYACDLGTDVVAGYRFDAATGRLLTHRPIFTRVKPGSGPRHLAMHPRGFHFLVNELSNSVSVLQHDGEERGFDEIQSVSTVPMDFRGENTAAEISLHPGGKFIYASNRGHDSIATFLVDEASGMLTPLGHTPTQGQGPRHFAVDPSGRLLLVANQQSNNVVVFQVDEETGSLRPTGRGMDLHAPACVVFATRSLPRS